MNIYIIVVIIIFVFAVIAGIVFYRRDSKKEGFEGVYGALPGTNPVKETFVSGKGGVVRVEYFYRPSCPHCVNYSPIFDKARSIIEREFPSVKIGKFDVSESANREKMNASTNGKQNTIPCVVLWYSNGGRVFLDQTKRNHLVEYVRNTESA